MTAAASDDEFSMPTDTPGWNRGSHVLPLAGLAGMYKIFSPDSRIGVLSLSSVQPVQRSLSVAADTPVHQVRSKFHQPAQYPCVGRDSRPNAMLQRSLQRSGIAGYEESNFCLIRVIDTGDDAPSQKEVSHVLVRLLLRRDAKTI